ncbi:MAG: hypothetical protein WAT51_07230, partial [Holophaga sp.]
AYSAGNCKARGAVCALRFALCAFNAKWYAYSLRPARRPGLAEPSHHEGLRLQHIPRTCTSKSLGSVSLQGEGRVRPGLACESRAIEESNPVPFRGAAAALPGMILE